MTAAAFMGLVLGVAALVIALALLAGFQSHIRQRLAAESPHLLVRPAGRANFRAGEGVAAKIAAAASGASAASAGPAASWGSAPTASSAPSVSPVVRGRVWAALRGQSVPLEAVGREGSKASGLALDSQAARALSAFPGDELTIVSSRTRLSPLGPVPIVASLSVAEVLPTTSGRRAAEAVLPLAEARRLLGLGEGEATAYEVRLADPSKAGEAAGRVAAALGPSARVTTWEEANRPLVLALRLERVVLFAAVFLIVVVAGLNLAATSAVLAATRARDAAILSVLGASPGQVMSVFLAAGALVGAGGTAAGAFLGAAVSVVLERTGAIPLPARLYSLSHVPFRLEVGDLLAVTVLSVLWSVAASAGPARAAARADVLEAIRGA